MMEYGRHQQFMLLVTIFMIVLLQIVQSSHSDYGRLFSIWWAK